MNLIIEVVITDRFYCTSFPIPFSNPPYGRNRTIEPIGYLLGSSTASVNSTTIFRYCQNNIVYVYDVSWCSTTTCFNKETPLSYSLITVWYVAVPVYRSCSRLRLWSLACASPRWFEISSFLSGQLHTTCSIGTNPIKHRNKPHQKPILAAPRHSCDYILYGLFLWNRLYRLTGITHDGYFLSFNIPGL